MANENGERAQQDKIVVVMYIGDKDHGFRIDDEDLVDLYLSGGVPNAKLIHLQKRVNDTAMMKARLAEAEARAKDADLRYENRANQILSLCGVLGLETEEQLEPTVKRMADALKSLTPEEVIALGRFLKGEPPCYSTGIDGGLTCGYGDLSDLGYWQYQMPHVFVRTAERALRNNAVRVQVPATPREGDVRECPDCKSKFAHSQTYNAREKLWYHTGMYRPPVVPLWIVGQNVGEDWEFQGVFRTEQEAIDACIADNYFVGPAILGERFQQDKVEWLGSGYPRLEPKP